MAPTTARPAPKKRTAKKTTGPAVAASDGAAEPLRFNSKPDTAQARVILFYVDDVPYTVPKKIGRNYGLRYLRTMRKQGEALAAQELIETLVSEGGYEALMGCDELTDDDLDAIITRLRDGALGEVEDETGGKDR